MQTLINTFGWVFVLYIIPAIIIFPLIRRHNKTLNERVAASPCDYHLYCRAHDTTGLLPALFLFPVFNIIVLFLLLFDLCWEAVENSATWKRIDSYLSGK